MVTVFCQGRDIGGNVTFWKEGKSYFYQSEGIGNPTKCSKKLYDDAVVEYKKQKRQINISRGTGGREKHEQTYGSNREPRVQNAGKI